MPKSLPGQSRGSAVAPAVKKPAASPSGNIALLSATLLVSAFLLFQVQLILSKYILPWFGGGPSVWTTALLCFQILLLGGYGYAHLLSTRLKIQYQTTLHLMILAASVALLILAWIRWPSPITPGTSFRPTDLDHPVWQIISILGASVALPFLILSATTPLLQSWEAQRGSRSPYRLYAISNLGSLLGLLSYPFLVEPWLRLRMQGKAWAAGYMLFAAGVAICARRSRTPQPAEHRDAEPEGRERPPSWSAVLLWAGLAVCASAMLLAVTNVMCRQLAPVPLLWVLPLALYLLSFIICFDKPRWYKRGLWSALYGLSLPLMLSGEVQGLHILQIAILPLILFSVCMVCHGELVRLKPAPRYLTSFYLSLSGGGALGGVFVALLAPRIFTYFWELPIALLSSGALLGVVLWKDRGSWLHRLRPGTLVAIFLTAFIVVNSEATLNSAIDNVVSRSHFLLLLTLISIPLLVAVLVLRGRKRWQPTALRCQHALIFSTFLLLVALHLTLFASINASRIAGSRNFFGVLSVHLDSGGRKILAHGTTEHGAQITIPPYTMLPTMYYDSESGVGLMLQAHGNLRGESSRQARIGVVGLGVGTLAAYSQPGNYMRFYEIDPAVVALSRGEHPQFTFLRDAAGSVDVVLGDARLALETEAARGAYGRFDILVLDAFADDSVPLHLLTLEAMQIYLRHLSGPDAVIAVHMSSRSTDLSPVLARLARRCGMRAVLVENDRDRLMKIRNEDVLVASPSSWVLLSRNDKSLLTSEVIRHGYTVPDGGSSPVWTDDYSNLLEVIRLKLDLLLPDSP